ncbi:hypothetical protein [Wolbachia endosymbiont (group B) of Limnophora tigrina]|uniref:hypothetical protein n=1 Tax=Wolbachia endosymbiont (group B) of Limnophora tigrina TaxID=3139317 RepID=UPI0035B55A96
MTIVDLNLQLEFLHYPLSSQYPLLSSQCTFLSSQYPLLSSQCVTLGSKFLCKIIIFIYLQIGAIWNDLYCEIKK